MTDSIRIANAKGLYLEGIRDGNMKEALDKYTGDRYTQHSTGVRDGKDGFIEFFTPFLERHPVRDIQFVFGVTPTHGLSKLSGVISLEGSSPQIR